MCCCTGLFAQYLETFTGQNGKGLVDAICPAGTTSISNCGSACTAGASDNTSTCTVIPPSFSGVDWSIGLGPSSTYFTDLDGFGFEFGSPDDFGVVSDRMQVDDPDQEVCWISPTLNIAAAGAVSIAIDVSQTGGLESGDYIRGDYSLNGGAFTTFETQSGAFAATQLNASGLTGTTLTVRVCAFTNGSGEQIFFDNVSVPEAGVTTGCSAPSVTKTISQAGTCNPGSGAILITASGGTAGYNVAWSGPASGNPPGTEIASSGGSYNIAGLSAGVYTITVTDAASCSATTTASVTTATALSLGTQVLPADCPGASTGEIDLTVNDGVPPYTYSWSNLPGSGDPQDQTGLAANSYTVTVTDNAGCTATTSATVGTATPGAYSETFSIDGKGILDNSTCSGANGTTCTNNNFVGVNWSIYGLPDLSGIDVNDYFKTTGGKLEGKDFDGTACWESPVIDINPPGTGVAFSVDLVWNDFDQEPSPDYIDVEYRLDGGSWSRAPNSAGGGSSGHTVVYANGSGNDIDGNITVNVSGLTGSTLQIRVCGNVNSESELFSIDNVSVPLAQGLYCPCPTISFTATPTNTCPGSNNGQITVSGVTGGSGPYMYSKDNGATFQSGATFTGLPAGNYQIVVKDATACTGGPQPVMVGTFTAPSCSIDGSDFTCNNSSGVTYSGPAGMSAYNWSISGAGGSIPGSTTGSSVAVTTGNFATDFTLFLTVTDGNGCTSTCQKQVFNYLYNPPANITVTPGASACFGVTLDLSVSAAASSTVAWTGEGVSDPDGTFIPDGFGGYYNQTTAIPTTTGPHTYAVTVTTDYGCSNTAMTNVMVNPLPTVTCPSSSSVCLNTPAYALTGGSPPGGTYGGAGVNAGMFDPASAGTGMHTITYTASDGNGCSNSCTFTITVNPLPTVTCPTYSSVCPDAPAFALTGGSPPGGTYSGPGVSAGMFDPASAGAGMHTITYTASDGNACSNTCTFTITVESSCTIDFSGKIKFSNNTALGVNNANVSLTGSATGSDLTDVNGDFFIATAVTSGSFTLKPSKTVNKLNGVTIGDVTAVQQHVASINLITDLYKQVAADVNKTNSINSTDISIINQSLLGNPAALAQFKTSWRFVPTSHTMSNPPWGFPEERTYTSISGSQTNQDFYGIKTGDIVTTFADPANFGAGQPLTWRLHDEVLQSGATLELAFTADPMGDLASFQCAFHFDTAQLQFIDSQPMSALSLTKDNFGLYDISQGDIRVAWSQPVGTALAGTDPVFKLTFSALKSGGKLSEALQLAESVLPGLSYNTALEESKVELKYDGATGTNTPPATALLLLQNRPNPFGGTTAIPFVLPENCEARLRIIDVSGRILAERKAEYPAGRNEETFDLDGATGILWYELTTPFGVLTKKMTATGK